MTNEEKIQEILYNHKNDTKWFMLEKGASEYLALKEMAQWKDQQFKEYLEKKRDSMKLFPTEYDMCQEIINEFFE